MIILDDIDDHTMINPCKISLFLYLTNSIHCVYHRKYGYAILLLLLTITSFLFRYFPKDSIYYTPCKIADLVILHIVGLYSTYIYVWKTNINPGPGILLFYILFIYYAGKPFQQFRYDIDKSTGLIYHSLIHMCSSTSIHWILMDIIQP